MESAGLGDGTGIVVFQRIADCFVCIKVQAGSEACVIESADCLPGAIRKIPILLGNTHLNGSQVEDFGNTLDESVGRGILTETLFPKLNQTGRELVEDKSGTFSAPLLKRLLNHG